jgi:hypothetical protein
MELVGSLVCREANRLGVAHPFLASILDGGVTKFATDDVAEHFDDGFLRALVTEKRLKEQGASLVPVVQELTFLAGAAHAAETQQGFGRELVESAEMKEPDSAIFRQFTVDCLSKKFK